MIDPSNKPKESKKYSIFELPLVDIIVYRLKIYRCLPWEYGGRQIFQWPTNVWLRKNRKNKKKK